VLPYALQKTNSRLVTIRREALVDDTRTFGKHLLLVQRQSTHRAGTHAHRIAPYGKLVFARVTLGR